MWDERQQYRLAMERRILRENMPDFTFHDPLGEATVEGDWESSAGKKSHIVISIPPGFPEECPGCYISDPTPLLASDDTKLERLGSNHMMHLWETDHPGWAKLCTYRPEGWSASHSIEKVLHKAMLWIEAYEGHLSSGRPINHFLLDMPS
ncbi:MAG: hypothetical protein HN348_21625 [Proteobacteria bacterium]|nr:hypothetical protein [Pseudomonadota bacterium]